MLEYKWLNRESTLHVAVHGVWQKGHSLRKGVSLLQSHELVYFIIISRWTQFLQKLFF